MMFPPALVHIRRVESGRRKLGLWLPIFLLWPLALVLLIALSPVLIVLALFSPFVLRVRRFFEGLYAAFTICCALRGVRIEVERENREVKVRIV